MKIKSDFVTNSSSSSYLLILPEDKLNGFVEFINSFTSNVQHKELEDLQDIEDYYGAGERQTEILLEKIKNGNKIFLVNVDEDICYSFMEGTVFKNFIEEGD